MATQPHDRPPPTPQADPAAESLTGALRSSFTVLRIVMIGLLILYVFSGVFKVQPGEQGLVSRLGKLREDEGRAIFEPGAHFVWPEPFDEKIRISGQIRTLPVRSFLFEPSNPNASLQEMQPVSQTLRPGRDGAMFTGDRTLSHAIWQVQYRIRRADKFVENVGDRLEAGEPLLLREPEIAAEVQAELQKAVDQLETGLEITKVTAATLEPRPVRVAYDAVTQAYSSKRKRVMEALQKEAEILNGVAGVQHVGLLDLINQYGAAQLGDAEEERLAELRAKIDEGLTLAGGEVAQTLQQAASERSQTVQAIQREYEGFRSELELYRQNPEATLLRRWAEMRAKVHASKRNEVFFLPDAQQIEVIINRDPTAAIRADLERFQREATGGQSQR
jgi:membrane protease subunit HflK